MAFNLQNDFPARVSATPTAQRPQRVDANEFKICRQDLLKMGPVGRFVVEPRIDCCAVSEGFINWAAPVLYDLKHTAEVGTDFPHELSTGKGFVSSGRITLPVYLPDFGAQAWFLDCAIMPYRRLKVYDDENPDTSATGWFDLMLGADYLKKVEELRQKPGGNVDRLIDLLRNPTV